MIRASILALMLLSSAAQAAEKPSAKSRSVILTGPAQLLDDAERQLSSNMDACSLPKGSLELEYELHRRETSTDDARSKLKARVERTLDASNLKDEGHEAEAFLRWLGSTRTMMRVSSVPGTDVNSDGFRKGFTCLVLRFGDQGYPTVPTLVAH